MTISSTTNRVNYTGNGVTTAFAFPYKFLANADLKVYQEGTLKTITTHYTVTGAGDDAGGTVTFLVAPANLDDVVIIRDPAILQGLDLVENDNLPAESLENSFDLITMVAQRLDDRVSRAFVLNDADVSGPDLTIPSPVADELIGWNSAGDALESKEVALLGAISIPVSIAQGGTGSATAADARSALAVLSSAEHQTQIATRFTADGTADAITGTLSPAIASYVTGLRVTTTPSGSNTVTGPTLNLNSLGTKTIKKRDSGGSKVALVAGDYNASGPFDLEYDGTDFILLNPLPAAATSSSSVPVRQTVLSGPVDSSGFAAFGGSTGSTTVTASGTLKATAAAGGDANYTGSIVNPSWTGLSTNGTMFLYLDITSGGVVTTGSTTLEPTYQWGGTYSTTNLQNTFNIQEMTMKVGNGSTASQVYRVFVGEVTVAGGVVTAITWYALMGRYISALYGIALSTNYTNSHNLGHKYCLLTVNIVCQTAELGYAIGDKTIIQGADNDNIQNFGCMVSNTGRNSAVTTTSSSTLPSVINRTTFATVTITAANWKFELTAQRSW